MKAESEFTPQNPLLDEQRALLEAARGDRSPEMAGKLNALGIRLREVTEFTASLECLREVVGILEELIGSPDDPRLATYVENLGVLLWDLGRPAEALACYERAKRLFAMGGDARPKDIALLQCNMGEALIALARYPDARENLEAALAYFQSEHGADHDDTRMTLRYLGRLDEAEAARKA